MKNIWHDDGGDDDDDGGDDDDAEDGEEDEEEEEEDNASSPMAWEHRPPTICSNSRGRIQFKNKF